MLRRSNTALSSVVYNILCNRNDVAVSLIMLNSDFLAGSRYFEFCRTIRSITAKHPGETVVQYIGHRR